MSAVFIELPPFERHRESYLKDGEYTLLQQHLLDNPQAGAVITGTGGLRKLRWLDESRGKGKRGGVRVIYYHFNEESQFWLFTIFNKDEIADLTKSETVTLKKLLTTEIAARRKFK